MSRETPNPPSAAPPLAALSSAVHFLRRGVRPDGTHEEGSDWEIASHQWGLFISWAYNRGVALPASIAPERVGGREHALRFEAGAGRWLKFTHPFAAGWAVTWDGGRLGRHPANPLQYLRRWRLVNRLFGDDTRLVGLSCLGRTQRIVVSQKHHEGSLPEWEEIDVAMRRSHGLRRLPTGVAPADEPERRAYVRGRLVVFDVYPANCVRTPAGHLVPYGVIPQILPRSDALALHRAIGEDGR